MKNIVGKIIIYLLVCMMQISVSVSVIEASSLHNGSSPMQQQTDNDQDRHEAERIENERHEQAMQRRPNESEREWHERQSREVARHERNLARIAHAILDVTLDK